MSNDDSEMQAALMIFMIIVFGLAALFNPV